jgi:hypothetical protein
VKSFGLLPPSIFFLLAASLFCVPLAADDTPPLRYVPDASTWQTPPIRPQGFQFEVQLSSLGPNLEYERVKASIAGHGLGEHESAVSKTMATEWGYSFTHLDGQVDGAGLKIEAGYPTPPGTRAECLPVIREFLQRQYIRGAPHPWASMNGHFPWHHYAAEFGFDQLGSEIGENINSYQWHIALTRGAARQYARPWFMDFSAWHGPGINDHTGGKIWGEYSHPDYGHSMSLFERSLFVSYMSGAGQITAEAGGALAFTATQQDDGLYGLSPYGEVCKRFNAFAKAHPNVGIPLTPFGLVLDYHHGAYPGFGARKAFWHFDYNAGDTMTWELVDLIWPGGWEVMGKDEAGTLVNTPYGDTVDVLLQNAPQAVLNSYPCLILSGDVRPSAEECARFRAYADQGGTLILNSAYLPHFPEYKPERDSSAAREVISSGKGRVIVYGPDYSLAELGGILQDELSKRLPVQVTGDVEWLVNLTEEGALVTLVNNSGVTKAPRSTPVVDPTQHRTVTVKWMGGGKVGSVVDIKNGRAIEVDKSRRAYLCLQPGEVVVLEFRRGR